MKSDIVKEKEKKFFLVMFCIVIAIGIIITLFGVVDYYLATTGKKPLFAYRSVNASNFDVVMPGLNDSVVVYPTATTYFGIGYTVSTCDNKSGNYTYSFGDKSPLSCIESISCSSEKAENDKYTIDYLFFEGNLVHIAKAAVKPAKQIKNIKTYESDFLKINDITGCDGVFSKIDDSTYSIYEACNIDIINPEDIYKVYSVNKDNLPKNKEDVINSYMNDEEMSCLVF